MLPFKRILCPTDFSEPAFTALKHAEELARHFAAELIVAHVIPPLLGPHSFPDPQKRPSILTCLCSSKNWRSRRSKCSKTWCPIIKWGPGAR